MKNRWRKALFAVLVLALTMAAGSCSLFAGKTYLAIDWYGTDLLMGTWDMPSPFNGSGWYWDTYYDVEPGSYFGEYALDYDGNGSQDSPAFYFDLDIEAKLFTDTNYYLYLDSSGPYLFYENKVPVARTLESDGSWVSSISTDDGMIILRSKLLSEPLPNVLQGSRSK